MKIKRNKLDILFSTYVRSKVKNCEYCGQYKDFKELQCSHFWGRRNQSVRFDEENIAVLCFACHQRLGENPEEHHQWFHKRLGENRYKALMIRAQTPQKIDKKMIELYLKAKLKKYD